MIRSASEPSRHILSAGRPPKPDLHGWPMGCPHACECAKVDARERFRQHIVRVSRRVGEADPRWLNASVYVATEASQSSLFRHQTTEVNLPADVMHHISMLIVLSYFM